MQKREEAYNRLSTPVFVLVSIGAAMLGGCAAFVVGAFSIGIVIDKIYDLNKLGETAYGTIGILWLVLGVLGFILPMVILRRRRRRSIGREHDVKPGNWWKGFIALAAVVLAAVVLAATLFLTWEDEQATNEEEQWTSAEFARQYERERKANKPEEKIAAISAALAVERKINRWPFAVPREKYRSFLLAELADAFLNRTEGDRADNFERAIKALESALAETNQETSPKEWANIQANLAVAYADRLRGERADNVELAIKACEAALTIHTRDAFPQDWAKDETMLGILYRARIRGERDENLGQAITAFEGALTVFTRSSEYWIDGWSGLKSAYRARAETHRTKGESAAAVASYTKAIDLDPTQAAAFSGRGYAYQEMGDFDHAISDFGKAIELNPKDAEAYDARGSSFLKTGRASQGLADANQSLALRPDNPRAISMRAHLFEALNQRDKAIGDYRRVLTLASEKESALRDDSKQGLTRLGATESTRPLGYTFFHGDGPNRITDISDGELHLLGNLVRDREAVKSAVTQYGEESVEHATAVSNLAQALSDMNRLSEAETQIRRAIAIDKKILGADSAHVAVDLQILATVVWKANRPADAERLFRQALAIDEKLFGPDAREVARDLYFLAETLRETNQLGAAEPLMRRALAIDETAVGPDDPMVGAHLNNLAELLQDANRLAEAEPLMRRALANYEKNFGPDSLELAGVLSNLAMLLADTGQRTEAEVLMRRAVEIDEKDVGLALPQLGIHINNLAMLLLYNHKLSEAQSLMRRALATFEKALVPDHPQLATALANLAASLGEDGKWFDALAQIRRATDLLVRHVAYDEEDKARIAKRLITRNSVTFRYHVLALYQAANLSDAQDESFRAGQWALQSDAADALRQMSSRFVSGRGRLADLLRELQDLSRERALTDTRLFAAIGNGDAQKADEQRAAYARIDARLDAITAILRNEFPKYSAMVSPSALTTKHLQGMLRPHEAVVQFVDLPPTVGSPESTFVFVWVVTSTGSWWGRSELSTPALIRAVSALRCGLDYAGMWFDHKGAWSGSRCNDLLGASYTRADHDDIFRKPLPFDLARSHELYRALFGQIEDLIKDKRLLIVPSGPLTQLPFQVLVTEDPKIAIPGFSGDYRNVAWLIRKHAITILPAVSSLGALRELAKPSDAIELYIGFGNPLLDGEPEKFKEDGAAAKLAREKKCEPNLPRRPASLVDLRGGARAMTRTNEGIADVADIRSWAPLPETADELCDVALDLGVDPKTQLYLGSMATETRIKQLSEQGALAKYRIVHFATHGAVAGQISRTSEPGLLLTPPDKASEMDDGYLSASEIAGLKLDADWVILSACNTAAGGAPGAEALSGLARAFFYAGARSLLVSHWEVASDSTVQLITRAVAELKADPKIGRGEALRRSMVSMMANGKDYEAHPSFWAPFVLVGEGAAAR